MNGSRIGIGSLIFTLVTIIHNCNNNLSLSLSLSLALSRPLSRSLSLSLSLSFLPIPSLVLGDCVPWSPKGQGDGQSPQCVCNEISVRVIDV